MKKFFFLFLITVFLACPVSFRAAERTISLFLDNKQILCNPSPILRHDRTMIPVRVLFEEMGATVSWNESARKVTLKYRDMTVEMVIDSDAAIVNGKTIKLETPPVIVEGRTMIPLRFLSEAIGATVSWNSESYRVDVTSPDEKIPSVIISDLTFSKKNTYDMLSMSASGRVNVKTMRLTEPNRMVLDLENALLLSKNAQHQGAFMNEVRYALHDNYVRVVAENDAPPRYIYTDNDGFITIRFYPKRGNFDYLGTEERKIIFPQGVSLSCHQTDSDRLVFSVKGLSMTRETVSINDGLVGNIEASKTMLTVTLTDAAKYKIDKNVILLIQTEPEKTEKENKSGLVILDAGHGGNDPGSIGYEDDGETILAKEKDMNLIITLKVYDILKAKGINVALTRRKDVYVGLVERADFANAKEAELFVSIHNNSIPDPDYQGTMVLYSLKSSGGKRLASNILEAVVTSAGTINHGLRNGTNMAVIKRTIMPAVIVECGCLSNREELENLMDDAFLSDVAEGIAAGIIKTLGR